VLTLRRNFIGLAVLVFAFAAVLTAVIPAASAAPKCVPPAEWKWVSGTYACVIPGGGDPGQPGDPGDGGGGTPAPPTCDLEGRGGSESNAGNPSPLYCIGTDVCYDADHTGPPLEPPEGEKPNEDSEPRVTWCYDGIMGPPGVHRIFWSGEEEIPSTYEQAMQAIGRIVLPTPDIHISPANRSIVNLDTWFWAEGLPPTESGSSAFGLVAYADFDRLVVDPGDGTGTLSCTATTSAAAQADCHHEYVRSSVRGSARVEGRPAFAVSAEAVYALRFEVGGNEVPVPGAPTTLTSPTATAALRVDEVQSVVTPRG